MESCGASTLLHMGDAEVNEMVSTLKDLTLNIVFPEEIILTMRSANSLNSHTA